MIDCSGCFGGAGDRCRLGIAFRRPRILWKGFNLWDGGKVMAKKLFIALVVAFLSLNLASLGISAGMEADVKGTVTKIDGGKVSIKDFMGDERTVEPKNPEALTNLKVGDRAAVKDGILTKEGGGVSPAPSPRPGY